MRGLYCSSHLTGDTVSLTQALEGCLTGNVAEGEYIICRLLYVISGCAKVAIATTRTLLS